MEQSFFDMMWHNTPFTALCIAVAALSGWVVYQFMRFNTQLEKNEAAVLDLGVQITKVEGRLDNIETRLNSMEVRLAVVETKLDALNEKVEKLCDNVDRLSEKFDRLIETLMVKGRDL